MPPDRQRKVVGFDKEVLRALTIFTGDTGIGLEDALDEALRDYLKKKGQPMTLLQALKESARVKPANDQEKLRKKSPAKKGGGR